MSFPDAGHAIPSAEAGNNIKFSELRLSYISNGSSGGDSELNNEEGILNLSFFRGVTFTSGDPIPGGSNTISIGADFSGKTFATAEGEGEPEPGGEGGGEGGGEPEPGGEGGGEGGGEPEPGGEGGGEGGGEPEPGGEGGG